MTFTGPGADHADVVADGGAVHQPQLRAAGGLNALNIVFAGLILVLKLRGLKAAEVR